MVRIAKCLGASARKDARGGIELAEGEHVPSPECMDSSTREVDELSLVALISFFRLLDRWDREANPSC